METKLEIELFQANPLEEQELKKIETKHNGSLGHWVGKPLHIVGSTRFDITYAVTRLSGYVTNLIKPAFWVLHHLMEYIHHHPHFFNHVPKRKISKQHFFFTFLER